MLHWFPMTDWNKRFSLSVAALVALSIGIFLTPGMLPSSDIQDAINPQALTGEYDSQDVEGSFHGQKVASVEEPISLAEARNTPSNVLGDTDVEKHIEVDLTNQRLYAFEGDRVVYDFLVSTGKWGRTPTGEFRIWGKFRATKMSGGSKERHTYYYLPNVPYVMFFSNDEVEASRGFSFHGTYWHENFGTPMSHGCVNMKTENAKTLYDWAGPDVGDKKMMRSSEENPGTRVVIYGETPSN